MLEGHAFEVFHGDEASALALADLVNGANVGMVERGGGASFATEAPQGRGVLGDVVGKEFQGYEPAEREVFGLVDDSHAATAELLDDAVVRDGLADHVVGRGSGRNLMRRGGGSQKKGGAVFLPRE